MSRHGLQIAITGAPGTGKTTLARLMQETLECNVVFEDLQNHPFVDLYFREPVKWSFHLSVFFMIQSMEMMTAVKEQDGARVICWDYDPRCHYEIFCKHLHSEELLSVQEYDTCRRLHMLLTERYSIPDLVVFLHADTGLLYKRINERSRDGEIQMLSPNYLAKLSQRFDHWAQQYRGSICDIDTSQLDLVNSKQDQQYAMDFVTREIQELGGRAMNMVSTE